MGHTCYMSHFYLTKLADLWYERVTNLIEVFPSISSIREAEDHKQLVLIWVNRTARMFPLKWKQPWSSNIDSLPDNIYEVITDNQTFNNLTVRFYYSIKTNNDMLSLWLLSLIGFIPQLRIKMMACINKFCSGFVNVKVKC